METKEKIIFSNSFGSITDKRITLNYKNGAEDLVIAQITSVSFQRKRNYIISTIGILISMFISVILLSNINHMGADEIAISLIIILFFIVFSIIKWIGCFKIQISANGNNRKPLKVKKSKKNDGFEFVEAIKKTIIN